MHIFHSGILGDNGKKIKLPEECGADIILSPVNLPPPTTLVAIERIHLPAGAVLMSHFEPTNLFEEFSPNFMMDLLMMKDLGAATNQAVLLLHGEGDGREIYFSPMRIWARHGGLPWFVPNNMNLFLELQKWEPAVQKVTLVDFLATLPKITRSRAKVFVEKYGVGVLKLLTLEYDNVADVLDIEGMEHMSVKDIKEIRGFLRLDDNEHLEVANLLIQLRDMAQELGGTVIDER